MDFRKTTLIAAVLMGVPPLVMLVGDTGLILGHSHIALWDYLVAEIWNLSPFAALPILLLLLLLGRIALSLSNTQRNLAVAAALLQGVVVIVFIGRSWSRYIHNPWHYVAGTRIGLSEWLAMPQVWQLRSDALDLLWRLGLLIFLAGLCLQTDRSITVGGRRWPIAILLAKLVAVFAVLVNPAERVYTHFHLGMRYYDTSLLAASQRLLPWSILPQFIAPAIVWFSLKQPRQPDSTISAHSDTAASSPEA